MCENNDVNGDASTTQKVVKWKTYKCYSKAEGSFVRLICKTHKFVVSPLSLDLLPTLWKLSLIFQRDN